MEGSLNNIIEGLSNNVPRSDKEYVGKDGLLRCSICHKKLQTVVNVLGRDRTVRCICDCKKKELEAYKEYEKRVEIEKARRLCFIESNMASWTFENDDKKNIEISKAMMNYADQFPDFKKSGTGLILYGSVGTGKTYYSACIANALINMGYSVLMTNFARLTNQIQGKFEGKQEYIDNLNRYALLIIDDLGAERKSEYMQEMVFNIIDSRYRSGLPCIITTNLGMEEIMNVNDIGYKRIYDRILERCYPIKVSGNSRRTENFKNNIVNVGKKLGL